MLYEVITNIFNHYMLPLATLHYNNDVQLEAIPDKERTGKQAFPCVLPGKVGSFLEGSRDEFADFSAQKACS